MGRRKIKAQTLWRMIIETQIETGMPYMLYKDSCNYKSNHKNLGTIKSSNLCTEIMQYTSSDETAVCNLASIALPRFIKQNDDIKYFDFEFLHEVSKELTHNLNNVLDKN